MKRYNIVPEVREFNWGKMSVISLGDFGRGRKLTLVPYHATKDAEFLHLSETKSGKPKIIKGRDSDNKWLARINTEGVYTRGTRGFAEILATPDAKDRIRVVAEGYGAYGAAGRIGSWADYLLVVQDNTLLKVKHSGGYKTPAYFLYFGEKEVLRIEKEELDLFAEQHDIDLSCGWKGFPVS